MPWDRAVCAHCGAAGDRSLDVGKPLYRPAVEDFTALFPGSWPDIDEPFRAADHVEIMFDDEQGVARRLETLEDGEQGFAICRVQPCRRLVKHIDHAEKL